MAIARAAVSLGAGFPPSPIYLVEYFYIEKLLINYLVTLRNTLDKCLISSLYLQ